MTVQYVRDFPGHLGNDKLNTQVATSVIEEQRESDPEIVFTYRGHRIMRMHNAAWKRSRQLAAEQYPKVFDRDCPEGFHAFRVHDLKHYSGSPIIPSWARGGGQKLLDFNTLIGTAVLDFPR
jgi:hypothetical protein